MNIHVSKEIQTKWSSHEFRGKPRISNFGFTYIEAKHKILGHTYFYIFEADSFIDRDGLYNGASELIFKTA